MSSYLSHQRLKVTKYPYANTSFQLASDLKDAGNPRFPRVGPTSVALPTLAHP